jgi:hypothetical protein
MEELFWNLAKAAGALVALGVVAYAWEKVRNAIAARIGLGGFYNRLPATDEDSDPELLIVKIGKIGDYLETRSVEHGTPLDAPGDWEWRLGSDLKSIALLADEGLQRRRLARRNG